MFSRAGIRVCAVSFASVLVAFLAWSALAEEPANEHFERVWARTDRPVSELAVNRTWMWGPEANSTALQEAYADAPGGYRAVQYFDKARMEINQPDADPSSIWYVTNGLLVNELMSGAVHKGNNLYDEHPPAGIGVAGDPSPGNGPSYAALAPLRSSAPLSDGALVTQRVDADGQVTDDPSLATHEVRVVYRVEVPGINHQIAGPFWTFMNSTGLISMAGALIEAELFVNPFFATGFPIIEPMWTTVDVAGEPTDVLLQCFERRCLTYTPSNADGWRVEAGNVGQHYYRWRYEQLPSEATPAASPTAPGVTATPEATESHVEIAAWGSPYDPSQQMVRPAALAVDANDNVFVVDRAANRVQIFDALGVLQTSWGAAGSGPGRFNAPSGIAIDAAGAVYIADRDNDRIQKLTAGGVPVDAWGSTGSAPGEFDGPVGLATDAAGRIYVADSRNHRVQRFSSRGAVLDTWGDVGTGLGALSLPLDVAVASDGTIYVADSGNSRIAVFAADGGYIAGWPTPEHSTPAALALLPDGHIAVADAANDRVIIFNQSGVVVDEWAGLASSEAALELPLGIAADTEGRVLVADFGNARVQIYTDGDWLDSWSNGTRGHFATPEGVAHLPDDGLTVVTDRTLDKVLLFDPDGVFVREWSTVNSDAGRLEEPAGLASDASGNIYVVDSGNDRVVVFDQDGTQIAQWGDTGTGSGQFRQPSGIAVDDAGDIYVADTGNDRIQKFDADGDFILSWGTRGSQTGSLVAPIGIAVWGNLVFVVDSGNARIQKFTLVGTMPVIWNSDGREPGDLSEPTYLATNLGATVYVSDTGNQRLQQFTFDGKPITVWGVPDEDSNAGMNPRGLASGADGTILVADATSQQVLVFVPTP
jgi:sugar lactone lactonase YvrE